MPESSLEEAIREKPESLSEDSIYPAGDKAADRVSAGRPGKMASRERGSEKTGKQQNRTVKETNTVLNIQ
jgi:hypothetical protein